MNAGACEKWSLEIAVYGGGRDVRRGCGINYDTAVSFYNVGNFVYEIDEVSKKVTAD